MKKITIILAMLLFVTFSFAHDENIPHYVNMENPAGLVNPDGYFEYMIVKGDYLWMLSDKFYNDPYKWTDINGANPYIVDPDWIYPNNWLVIPNIFVDDNGNPIYSGVTKTTSDHKWVEESTTWSETSKTWGGTTPIDLDGDGIADGVDIDGDGVIDKQASIDLDGDGIIDGYDIDGDGNIDLNIEDSTLADTAVTTTEEANITETISTKETAAANAITSTTGSDSEDMEKSCNESYCGKPGWKLGLHAGYPVGGGPEGENLNLGLLLGTPLGLKVGPLSVGLGAGAFTYDFNNYYIGGGLLASLCINDLLKLDMPLILQLHGIGFYIFGEEQGLGIGTVGSASIPIGKTPLSIGLYGALGKYYPGNNNYNWSNMGAVLFYSL